MIKIPKFIISLIFFLGLLFPNLVSAHQPVIEPVGVINESRSIYAKAFKLEDPSQASLAVYGALSSPDEFDFYAFASHSNTTIPIELLVPAWPHNKAFHPSLVIISKASSKTEQVFPVDLPEEYGAQVLNWSDNPEKFYEPFSQERLLKGVKFELTLQQGKNYFFAVYNPDKQVGEYVLALGKTENFNSQSKFNLIKNLIAIKLNLFNHSPIPWLDIFGLFLLLAGAIISLGQDLKSSEGLKKYKYWLGFGLIGLGGVMLFRESWLSGVVLFQALLILIIIINKLVYNFYSLPKNFFYLILINKIISFICWWTILLLLVWYLLMQQ